jgi:hypothetical protein
MNTEPAYFQDSQDEPAGPTALVPATSKSKLFHKFGLFSLDHDEAAEERKGFLVGIRRVSRESGER